LSRSSSRRAGDYFQDVYGWFRALELMKPARKVWRVSIEDPSGELFDDVTLRPEVGTSHAPEFAQVKFHVDFAGAYSTDEMMTQRSKNGRSLLQKAWDSWLVLRQDHAGVQLLLVTTWAWHPDDPIARHIRRGVRLTEEFIEGRCDRASLGSRTTWYEHLGSPDEDLFKAFLRSFQIRVGYPATSELMEWTAERMELAGLKSDEKSIRRGADQILDWIIEPRDTIYRTDMEEAIERLDLRDPGATPELAVSLYIHTILREPLETDGDYELDWRDHFEGEEWLRGHRVHDPAVWNRVMLPELVGIRERIMGDTPVRFLRARGKARLSAWFAIGWVFSRVAGWTIEVDQNGNRWRDDAEEAEDVALVDDIEDLGGEAGTLAVGVSITGDLSGDVRAFLADSGTSAERLLHVRSGLGSGPAAIRSAGDLTALAHLLRDRMRTALERRPRKVLLFYFGPLAGAAFIGASLNAVAPEIQIFEDQNPGYAPSFTFHQ
jgi:hypothetical protein